MASEFVKVGVIGVGYLGRFHALNYIQIPGVRLVGVYDQNYQRAVEVAKEANCQPYADFHALLDEVEAVSLAVPTDRHGPLGIEILERGIHCLIEKPITDTIEEADALIRTAKANGAILQVGHVERFNPAMRVLSGLDLQPRFIEAHRLAPFNPRGTEVSVILDLMIHDIDIVLHFIPFPVVDIRANGVAVVSDSVDIASARLEFENGSVAHLTASRISQKKMRRMRLFQKDTYIGIDFLEKYTEIYTLSSVSQEKDMVLLDEIGIGSQKKYVLYKRPKVPETGGLYAELEAFVQTIRGENPPAVTGEEARAALSVAMQILNHMET